MSIFDNTIIKRLLIDNSKGILERPMITTSFFPDKAAETIFNRFDNKLLQKKTFKAKENLNTKRWKTNKKRFTTILKDNSPIILRDVNDVLSLKRRITLAGLATIERKTKEHLEDALNFAVEHFLKNRNKSFKNIVVDIIYNKEFIDLSSSFFYDTILTPEPLEFLFSYKEKNDIIHSFNNYKYEFNKQYDKFYVKEAVKVFLRNLTIVFNGLEVAFPNHEIVFISDKVRTERELKTVLFSERLRLKGIPNILAVERDTGTVTVIGLIAKINIDEDIEKYKLQSSFYCKLLADAGIFVDNKFYLLEFLYQIKEDEMFKVYHTRDFIQNENLIKNEHVLLKKYDVVPEQELTYLLNEYYKDFGVWEIIEIDEKDLFEPRRPILGEFRTIEYENYEYIYNKE